MKLYFPDNKTLKVESHPEGVRVVALGTTLKFTVSLRGDITRNREPVFSVDKHTAFDYRIMDLNGEEIRIVALDPELESPRIGISIQKLKPHNITLEIL